LAQVCRSRALVFVQRGRGRFFPDLLVAALQRAVALAEMDRVALAVAEDLDLDMAGLAEVFLDIDGASPKAALASERAVESATRARPRSATFMPRPPPPAAALMSTG
jgi:hypothetical protein